MLLNWLIFGVPWWAQVAGLLALAGILIFLATMIFGVVPVLKALRPLAVPFLAVLGAIGLLSRAQQQGYKARKVEEDQAARKAETIVENERVEVQGLPDDQLDERVDKWSRH